MSAKEGNKKFLGFFFWFIFAWFVLIFIVYFGLMAYSFSNFTRAQCHLYEIATGFTSGSERDMIFVGLNFIEKNYLILSKEAT